MSSQTKSEYRLIVEGFYRNESEAEHALRDPFIEDWVEKTGRFRVHNLDDIEVAHNVPLSSLGIFKLEDEVFEIVSVDEGYPLTEQKAKLVAESLRRQAAFDEIAIEPIEDE
jgi:hypothetical protein